VFPRAATDDQNLHFGLPRNASAKASRARSII
jgi:hypothetical protein